MKKNKGFFWHIHHHILLEYCYDYKERVEAIKEDKPENEIPTRLRLMKPVKAKLPKEFMKARQEYEKAWQEYEKAGQEYKKTLLKYKPLFEKLHKKECGCKEWDGEEIVFKKNEQG